MQCVLEQFGPVHVTAGSIQGDLQSPCFWWINQMGLDSAGGEKPLFLNACHLLQGHKASLILPWRGNTSSHCCKVWQRHVLATRLCGRPGEREQVPGQPRGRCLIPDPPRQRWEPGCRAPRRARAPWLLEERWPWGGGLGDGGSAAPVFRPTPPQRRAPGRAWLCRHLNFLLW